MSLASWPATGSPAPSADLITRDEKTVSQHSILTRRLAAPLIATGTLFLAACGNSALGGSDSVKESDTITVGAVVSLTGAGAGLGVPASEGLKLAAKEVNAEGGIDGKKIELIIKDDGSDPENAASLADTLIKDNGAKVIIGSSLTAQTDAIAAKTGGKVPQIAFTGLGPEVELSYDHLFHVLPPQKVNAQAILSYAEDVLHAKTLGVLYDNGFGAVVHDQITAQAKDFGITLKGEQEGEVAATDVTSQAAAIVAAKPDAVAVVTTNPVYFRNLDETGNRVPVIGSIGSASYETVRAMGDAGDGVVLPEFVVAEDPLPNQADFIKAFQAEYDALPKNFEAAGYDALGMVAEALKTAGPDASSDEIGAALAKPYDGVMAEFDFSADDFTGIGLGSYVYSQIKNGSFLRLDSPS
jgi:branched-chain amino acid transport system substrate-binding protein